MKDTRYFCDKCGVEISLATESLRANLINEKPIKYYVVAKFKFYAGHTVDGDHTYPIDLCENCAKKMLVDLVEGKDVTLSATPNKPDKEQVR